MHRLLGAIGVGAVISALIVGSFVQAVPLDLSLPRHVDCLPNADIDGDGHLDCVQVTHPSFGGAFQLEMRRGLGGGQFAAAEIFNVATVVGDEQPTLDLQDFDGDGLPDPCISFHCPGCVCAQGSQVLFHLRHTIFSQLFDTAPAVVRIPFDLDGDGDLDLVSSGAVPASGTCTGAIKVFVNDGSGHYAPGVEYPGGTVPGAIAVADFTGEHRPDIAISSLQVYLPGAGGGIFGLPVPFLQGTVDPAFHLARARDLDGNGTIDLIFANQTQFHVLLGDTQGAFDDSVYATSSTGSAALDLDANGDEDYVLDTPNAWTLMRHTAGNRFSAMSLGPRLPGSSGIVSADFNGDGRPDFVDAGASDFRLFLSGAPFAWAPGRSYAARLANPTAVDYDEDGSPDLLVPVAAGGYDLFAGQPGGEFFAPLRFGPTGDGRSLALGDIDGDGKADAIVSRSDGFAWSAGLGTGDFGPPHLYTWADALLQTRALVLADLDADGHLDIVVARQGLGAGGDVAIVMNAGGGSLATEVPFAAGIRPTSVVVRDFDRDGHLDVLVNDTATSVDLLFGLGGGALALPVAVDAGGAGTLAAGDFDGNGRLDFAAHVFEGTNIVLNLGSRTFAAPSLIATGAGARFAPVLVADIDRNGRSDLAVVGPSNMQLARSLPDGHFTPPQPLPGISTAPVGATFTDFDLDGNPDLAIVFPDGASPATVFRAYRGTGGGTFEVQAELHGTGSLCAAGQVTGDAKPEVVLASALLVNRTGGTTPVTIQHLTATIVGDHVVLGWSIAAPSWRELASVSVERAGDAAGPFVTLTPRGLAVTASMTFEDPVPPSGTTWYRLGLVHLDGSRETSTGVDVWPRALPARTVLQSVRPGKAPGSAEIRYFVGPRGSNIELAVYDVRGRIVTTLASGRVAAGAHVQTWDGSTATGAHAARGVYLISLAADGRRDVRKFLTRTR